jgi:hypothetical protein
VPANSASKKESATEYIHLGVTTVSEIKGEWLTAFLYEYALTFKKTKLEEDWISYGVTIGKKGTSIGPMDLLKRIDGAGLDGGQSNSMIKWIDQMYCVIMTSRMKKVRESPDPNYINSLNTKLTTLGKGCLWKGTITSSIDTSRLEGALEDPNVKRILAAIDMYLFRFDQHELSFL